MNFSKCEGPEANVVVPTIAVLDLGLLTFSDVSAVLVREGLSVVEVSQVCHDLRDIGLEELLSAPCVFRSKLPGSMYSTYLCASPCPGVILSQFRVTHLLNKV